MTNLRSFSFLFLVCCLPAFFGSCHFNAGESDFKTHSPENIVHLKGWPVRISLGPWATYLEDPDRALTLEQVRERSSEFKDSEDEVLNFGLTGSAVWVRFILRNESDRRAEYLLEYAYPPMDSISVYSEADGRLISNDYGDHRPFSERPMVHRNLILPLRLEPGVQRTFYLRFQSESVMDIPLYLWSPDAFRLKDRDELLTLGFFYGILFVMFFYNLFLFFSVRRTSFLFYVIYIGLVCFLELGFNGLAYEYIWPRAVWFNDRAIPLFSCLAMAAMVQFTRSLLQFDAETAPRVTFGIHVYTAGLFVLFLLFLFMPLPGLPVMRVYRIGIPVTVINGIIVTAMGLIRLFQGHRPARFFFLAWSIFLVAMVAHNLKNLGILPSVFLTNYGMQIGISIEAILFSFALGDYINVIRKEQEHDRARYIETRQVAAEQAALLDQANLRALQDRMSPHFLFNSLNMIYSLLAMGKSGKASDAVMALAENYSFLVENTSDLVPFDTEWEFMTNYCRLVEMRFHKKIAIHMDRRGDFRRIRIPPITLQPFIENSVKHGFRRSGGAGAVLIKARAFENGAFLRILDNGTGLQKTDDSRTIANIRQRLEYYYENVSVSAAPRRRGGVRFEIEFSKEKKNDGTENHGTD